MTGYDKSTGIDELFKNLDSLPEKIEKKLFRKGLKQISERLVSEVKSYVPTKTGKLKNSIAALVRLNKKKGGIVATIGSSLFYSRFVELGFMHKGGVHVPARPFLTPVLENAAKTVPGEMREFLEAEVIKEMGRAAKSTSRGG